MGSGGLFASGIFLLLFSTATLAVECPSGFIWDRMSGPGCIQADCDSKSILHAHYSYTKDCICGTDDCIGDPLCVECYEPVDYTGFDKKTCGIFCPGIRLYTCVKAGERCPKDKTPATTNAVTTIPAQIASSGPVMPSIAVITNPTTTTAPKEEDCGAICRKMDPDSSSVLERLHQGMLIQSNCYCACPAGYKWIFKGFNKNGTMIIDPINCPVPQPSDSYSPEELKKIGCGDPVFACKQLSGDLASLDLLWNRTLYECNHKTSPNLTVDAFLLYLRKVEEQNPEKNWKQIIAKLHRIAYKEDFRRDVTIEIPWTGWVIGWDLFKDGQDTQGYEDVDLICITPPKFVWLNGKKIDIAHSYAGLRSDLNRRHYWETGATFGASTWVMRHANTDWGDYFRVITSLGNWNYAPPDQLDGDDAGVWLANYYQDKKHENTPLSEAYAEYFAGAR